MPTITQEVYTSMGLTRSEYELILSLLKREPTYTELGMFAVMWSEHCGYKYSRPVLALFKRYKEALEGKGFENAGLVDIGDGLGVTMKVESHNHPSAVEPYEGAATGVGGIIRDILTMGARPIALLNSLRFGPIEGTGEVVERNRYLFEHVVAGIGGYGNCVGVPTVGGEVGFHERYSGNPLVNAMCVGILNLKDVTTAGASGVGNPVIYLGSATGKDGIHGATFASDALGEDSDAKRPNVQIGDPFAEKLLIEATLEALKTGAVVAIQDMGAAGLTCSTVEMASKGGVGMEVDLDLVPMREDDMTGYELMLSESQERMLAVAEKGRESEIIDVFHKWGLKAVVIGHITGDNLTTIRRHGKIEAQLDATLLTDFCPVYHPPSEEPAYFKSAKGFSVEGVPVADARKALLTLLASPELASKRWVFQQYDQHVLTQTVFSSGQAEAAVILPRGAKKGLAIKIDGNSRQTHMHPYIGGLLTVAESARNVACTGARPRALTDGLNFGNPQNPNVYWQFSEAVRGIAEAAEAMGTPVISGNVSFYNESELGEVPPTPVIGMLGILEDGTKALPLAPAEKGELYLISARTGAVTHDGLGAGAYLAYVHGIEDGYPVAPDLEGESNLCEFLAEAAEKGAIQSAHDCSEGGLAVALAEIAVAGRFGLEIDLPRGTVAHSNRSDAMLFGELPGRVIVGIEDGAKSDNLVLVRALAEARGLTVSRIGAFSAGDTVKIAAGGEAAEWSLTELETAHGTTFERLMGG